MPNDAPKRTGRALCAMLFRISCTAVAFGVNDGINMFFFLIVLNEIHIPLQREILLGQSYKR